MESSYISGVASLDIGVPILEASRKFYTDTWILSTVQEDENSVYLRGSGSQHHILALHKYPTIEALRINLLASNMEGLEKCYDAVRAHGTSYLSRPDVVHEPGGGYGFAFKDIEGRTIRILTGQQQHPQELDDPDQPEKLAHVVMNTPDRARLAEYFCQVLGVRVIDRTKVMTFLCAGRDHHCIAIAGHPSLTLNHLAFETRSVDAVMRGAGRLKDKGVSIEWGVGRHGPGHNVFAYFLGPDEEIIEYTADVMQVDGSYPVGTPEDWVWPPGRNDHWGINTGPSAHYKAAQSKIRFADDVFVPASGAG